MVHPLYGQALKIGHVTGNMKRQNLPLAIFRNFRSVSEAAHEHAALSAKLTLSHDVRISRHVLYRSDDGTQGLDVFVG